MVKARIPRGAKFIRTVSLPSGKRVACRLYNIWDAMRKRCYKPSSPNYRYYGARGIRICDEWRTDYAAFRAWAVSNGYGRELTIDRIDNYRGYDSNNCRWATRAVQQANKRRNGPIPRHASDAGAKS